nr:uncharacterized protein LOC110376998 isoform X2 [Helicoverpa armigera]
MNVFTQTPRDEPRATHYIEIVEPEPAHCQPSALPPEGHGTLRGYRLLNDNLCAFAPGDKDKLAPRYDVCSAISPPRSRILELLRPEDPGRDALEAIVRPIPRRGLTRPLDEDTRRFLQRALQSPSPLFTASTPEPHHRPPESPESDKEPEIATVAEETSQTPKSSAAERSLADELAEAEEAEREEGARRELVRRGGEVRAAAERERLARLALAVEEDEAEECALSATARRLDALLAQSRDLHCELADIHADLQVLARRLARRDP